MCARFNLPHVDCEPLTNFIFLTRSMASRLYKTATASPMVKVCAHLIVHPSNPADESP